MKFDPEHPWYRGTGWAVSVKNGWLCLRFNHCPDHKTIRKLAAWPKYNDSNCPTCFGSFHAFCGCSGSPPIRVAWHLQFSEAAWEEAVSIGNESETWESVGEEPEHDFVDPCRFL